MIKLHVVKEVIQSSNSLPFITNFNLFVNAKTLTDFSTYFVAITHVINAALTNGVFPGGWKQAEVTPIPKEGDHEQPCNNRPIDRKSVV